MSIEETVWKFLRSNGLPELSCAAVMGNIYAESGFDEKLVEVGSGIGFGLCQWSYERRTQLEAYGTDITHQLTFMWAELTGKNTSSINASYQWIDKSGYLTNSQFLKGSGSIADLTAAMCFCWERPNASVAHLDVRQSKANEYYSKFTGMKAESANSQSDVMTIESTNYQVVANSDKKGDFLFGRRYRITVSDENGNGMDVSQLRCTFNIVKTIQMEPNSSEITIYNLNAQTENFIMISGKRVTVEAGYEGSQFGLIFDGDILQTFREREDGNTFKLTIIALDSDRAINFDISNFSLVRGQTARDIVEHIVNKASNPVDIGSISEKLNGQKLTRGKVVFGKASDYIRQLAKSHELQYYMDDGRLHLISLDELPEGEIFELNPQSGLIGTPEQTDYGLSGQCLLNPQIKLNSLIHIDNSLVRAKRIEINGSNAIPSGEISSETNTTGVRNKIIAEAKKICDDPNVEYSQEHRGQTIGGITYWDCSSFVKHCYGVAGLSIVDITGPQYKQVANEGGKFVLKDDALPGDLVFWGTGDACSHVAIYAGNGYVYAARGRDGKIPVDQVAYHALYGNPSFGRPKCLIDADKGQVPNCSSSVNDGTAASQTLFRSLDKDGIYRVIKITYEGDTRGQSWYLNFETIDQLGGAIPVVSN